MRLDFQASVAKRADELNEDVYRCLPFRHRYALSDGATESFAPRQWAQTIVSAFLDQPQVDRDWLRRVAACHAQGFDRETMPWSAQAAFDRGSFATLTGLVLNEPRQIAQVLAIGDSLAVLVAGDQLQATFPYQHAVQFLQRPLLLATHFADNARLLVSGVLAQATVQWSLRDLHQPVLLLMTDALGGWLLTHPKTRLPVLLRLKNRGQFERLVQAERVSGRLRRDDTTLLRIR